MLRAKNAMQPITIIAAAMANRQEIGVGGNSTDAETGRATILVSGGSTFCIIAARFSGKGSQGQDIAFALSAQVCASSTRWTFHEFPCIIRPSMAKVLTL